MNAQKYPAVHSAFQLVEPGIMVIAHQTFGDMLRWNPHFHAILLEGGFKTIVDAVNAKPVNGQER
jgi:hypothetical protein